MNDEDENIQTDAAVKDNDVEIEDYSNYQPTETKKEEDAETESKEADQLIDEDKIYGDK